ncbi:MULTISPECIES: PHP domain-containing protein [Protofrankia]|uniref:PHP domain-containing protein n=1 Tax=Protofrankia TaxID=2994361 RepID=UPI0009FB06F2|nr:MULTISPECIES: PHP domain-containing protein [Protofrankia]
MGGAGPRTGREGGLNTHPAIPADAADLHTHSTASDGLLPPADVVRLAAASGLAAIALTDHDTTAGLAEAAAALPAGLTLLPGAEISCRVRVGRDRWVSLHLLAYLFDPVEPVFAEVRARLRAERVTRAQRMVEKLAADGHPVAWERVRALADGVVGRPHVAEALVEAGLVGSVQDAFTPAWIGAGGRYWVDKDEPDVAEAIRLVRDAGGVSVLAHAFASRRGATIGPDVIARLARDGLGGLEVDHPDHTPDARARLRQLATDLDLIVTGASDFHGASKPQSLGAETTTRRALDALVAAGRGTEPLTGQDQPATGPAPNR